MVLKLFFLFIISCLFVSCAKKDEAAVNPDLPPMEGDRSAFRQATNLGVDHEVEAKVVSTYNSYWTLFVTERATGGNGYFYGFTRGLDRSQLVQGTNLTLSGTWYNSWIMGYPQEITIMEEKRLEYSGTVSNLTANQLYIRNPRIPNSVGTTDPYNDKDFVVIRICSKNYQVPPPEVCPDVPEEAKVVGARITVSGLPIVNAAGSKLAWYLSRSVTAKLEKAKPFQNKSAPADVNSDGVITPLDLLIMSNSINRYLQEGSSLDLLTQREHSGISKIDVSGDNYFSALDVLNVINEINRRYNSAAPFYNSQNPRDVNHDGSVTPLDMLIVINASNRFLQNGVSSVDLNSMRGDTSLQYIDLNGDNRFTSLDLLLASQGF